eukprot:Skav211473  [mRNA]  locus=scaffold1118:87712:89431:- [translate_table: standard]
MTRTESRPTLEIVVKCYAGSAKLPSGACIPKWNAQWHAVVPESIAKRSAEKGRESAQHFCWGGVLQLIQLATAGYLLISWRLRTYIGQLGYYIYIRTYMHRDAYYTYFLHIASGIRMAHDMSLFLRIWQWCQVLHAFASRHFHEAAAVHTTGSGQRVATQWTRLGVRKLGIAPGGHDGPDEREQEPVSDRGSQGTIMRLHRVKLDPAMRSLGDTYARKEFRLHAKPQARPGRLQIASALQPRAGARSTHADVPERMEGLCGPLAGFAHLFILHDGVRGIHEARKSSEDAQQLVSVGFNGSLIEMRTW